MAKYNYWNSLLVDMYTQEETDKILAKRAKDIALDLIAFQPYVPEPTNQTLEVYTIEEVKAHRKPRKKEKITTSLN